MSTLRLILAGLTHHRRIHAAVALGVAAATAVLVGALVVGDSVRQSLRDITLDRLGQIDEVLVTERFFRAELAAQIAASDGFGEHYDDAVPAVLLRGTLEKHDEEDFENVARANQVTVIGSDARFWKLGEGGPDAPPGEDQIVLNRPLADELGAKVGDEVTLRIPQLSDIPADSPMGRKGNLSRGLSQLKVTAIVPAEGLGRFGMHPSQQLRLNAFVATKTLQAALDQDGKVNAIFVAGKHRDRAAPEEASKRLQESLRPSLGDYGMTIEIVDRRGAARPVSADKAGEKPAGFDEDLYYSLASDSMLLPEALVQAVADNLTGDHPQPMYTYLANTIAGGSGREIPYSTITAIDSNKSLGPLLDKQGEPIVLADDQIVLNDWTAKQMGVAVGDEVRVTFFEPESTHGEAKEQTVAFTLAHIVPIRPVTDPHQVLANDRYLTPRLPGVTDQRDIGDWDAPFPFKQSRVKDADEQYWDDYRTTPKAFISLAAGRQLWGGRFGDTTSIRVAAGDEVSVDRLRKQLNLDAESLGFQFRPVKRYGLMASSGTTPFDVLFLMFSFFIIAAALMLVLLLFRLAIEQRSAEIGIMAASGMRRKRIRRLMMGEGLVVSCVGGLIGVAVGVGYAKLMIAALTSPDWWQAAVSTPFLRLHRDPLTLVIGYGCGVLASALTIIWSLRRLGTLSIRRLLAGESGDSDRLTGTRSKFTRSMAGGMLIVATLTGLMAVQLGGEVQIGGFFGSGALVLAACLTYVWWWLKTERPADAARSMGLMSLAARNAARSPGRSVLTIGLVASASFLIVAISAFQLGPSREGAGGYAIWAESDRPVHFDINTADGRYELGFDDDADKLLAEATTVPLRMHAGDNASCLNLYRPDQPRVLGVSPAMVAQSDPEGKHIFSWDGSAAKTDNPWRVLDEPLEGDNAPTPVVLDVNTARYSLQLWQGVGETYDIEDAQGRTVTLQIVGLLKNSIFQGDILMSEANFKRHFPDDSGYRLFLVSADERQLGAVTDTLETTLGDYGLDASRTAARLDSFFAVQNTYLSTFQSLGGLGLLLGTFGLATVQLRNVFERRRELALMRSVGFRRGRLARMVMIENAVLLGGGLGAGVLAAAVAVLPHFLLGGAAIPMTWLAGTLGLVLGVGLLAGLSAVRATLRAPILSALRGD